MQECLLSICICSVFDHVVFALWLLILKFDLSQSRHVSFFQREGQGRAVQLEIDTQMLLISPETTHQVFFFFLFFFQTQALTGTSQRVILMKPLSV